MLFTNWSHISFSSSLNKSAGLALNSTFLVIRLLKFLACFSFSIYLASIWAHFLEELSLVTLLLGMYTSKFSSPSSTSGLSSLIVLCVLLLAIFAAEKLRCLPELNCSPWLIGLITFGTWLSSNAFKSQTFNGKIYFRCLILFFLVSVFISFCFHKISRITCF